MLPCGIDQERVTIGAQEKRNRYVIYNVSDPHDCLTAAMFHFFPVLIAKSKKSLIRPKIHVDLIAAAFGNLKTVPGAGAGKEIPIGIEEIDGKRIFDNFDNYIRGDAL
ncbi:MAG: hypothetical protein PHP98_06960 [Kiritimatiellae bacterium]|nr:hypothetical protein [Kiritimatiellia bacterium]